MRIERVLVPVDFSPLSTIALNHAVLLARQFRAKLILLHVVEPAVALMYAFPTETEASEKQRCERARRMLAAMLAPEDEDDLDVETDVVVGEIALEIERVVHQEHADMVVMGTHGRGLIGRWLIGSVTQSILRSINVPILTICHATRPLSFKRILFATDFSKGAAEGLDFTMDLAAALKSEVVVAHVIHERPMVTFEAPEAAGVFDTEKESLVEEARNTLKHIESDAKSRNMKIETALAEGSPAETIIRIADENTIDFVVLAVSRKNRIDRILLGTTADKVIRDANVPVLSIPVRHAAERSDDTVRRGVNGSALVL